MVVSTLLEEEWLFRMLDTVLPSMHSSDPHSNLLGKYSLLSLFYPLGKWKLERFINLSKSHSKWYSLMLNLGLSLTLVPIVGHCGPCLSSSLLCQFLWLDGILIICKRNLSWPKFLLQERSRNTTIEHCKEHVHEMLYWRWNIFKNKLITFIWRLY